MLWPGGLRRGVGAVASGAAVLAGLVLAAPAAADTGPAAVDSFSRADGPSLGTAESGQAWQNHAGGFSLDSGAAAAGSGYGLSTLDAGAGAASVSVTVTSPGEEFWLVVRLEDAANYWRFGRWRGEGYQLQQIRNNGLGSPDVTVLSSADPAPGDTIECRSGAVLACSVNDMPVVRTHDTFAAGASRHGFATWNSTSVRFDNFAVSPLLAMADLSATIDAPGMVPSGAAFQARSTVVNSGSAAARDVVIEWSSSPGLTSVVGTTSSGTCTTNGTLVRCPVGDLSSGAQAAVTLSANAPAGAGSVRLDVRALQTDADAEPADDAASASVTLRPDLSAATVVSDGFDRADSSSSLGTAETGQAWTNHHGQAHLQAGRAATSSGYTLSSLESGVAEASVAATVTAPGSEFWLVFRLSSDADYWRFGRSSNGAYQLQQIRGNGLGAPALDRRASPQAEAGDRLECRLTDQVISCSVDGEVVVRTADAFNRSATRHGFAAYESPALRLDDFRVDRVVPQPDLRVSLAAPNLVPSESTYTVSATAGNHGPVPATGSTVRVTLAEDVTATSAQTGSGTCTTSTSEVVCEVGTLQPTDEVTVTITALAPAATGPRTTTVLATALEPDRDADDNRAIARSLVYDSSQPPPVVVDSFSRADSGSLGTSDTGQAWQAWWGSPAVEAGTAAPGPGYSLATVDSGTADGAVGATVTQPGTEFWLVVRAAGPADYWRFGRSQGGTYQLQLIRGNGLASPAVTTLETVQPAAGDKIECRASTGLSCSVNGRPVVRTTDATGASATRHGLGTWNSPETRFGDFQVLELARVPDLAVSVTGTRSVTVSGRMQLRASVNNAGTAAVNGAVIDGVLAAGLSAITVTAPGGSCPTDGNTFRCSLGQVTPSQDIEVLVEATAPSSAGQVVSSVHVSHSGTETETANDSADLTTVVRLPAPPGSVVTDNFDRAAPADGLGNADSGEVWQVLQGAFTIDAGEASSTTGATSLAVVDAGFAFGTYEATVIAGATERFWLAFRVQDSGNYFRLGADQWSGYYTLSKVTGGAVRAPAINFTRANVRPRDGDVVRLVLRPDDGIYVYVNGEQIIDAGDPELMDATGFGLSTASTSPRFDGLEVSSTLEAFPIADTFSRPDAQTLGAPEVGTRYPWKSWEGPQWAVSGGRAHYTSTGYGLTAIDTATESASAKVTFSTPDEEQWLVFRFGEDRSYYRFGALAGGQYAAEFVRDGSTVAPPVQIQVVNAVDLAPGDVVEVVQRLGGAVETRVNGVVTHRFTDPSTNVRATIYGLATSGESARFDDFAVTPTPR